MPIVFVVDEKGQPIAGAEVSVLTRGNVLSADRSDNLTTDDHGRAIVVNPGIGYSGTIVEVNALKPGFSSTSGSIQWATNAWGTLQPSSVNVQLAHKGDLQQKEAVQESGIMGAVKEAKSLMYAGAVAAIAIGVGAWLLKTRAR